MAELKTKPSDQSVAAFVAALDPSLRDDATKVIALMQDASGEPPTLWGASMVGFGRCHMVYESGRSLDWFLVGFSPRKANLTLYIMPGFARYDALLAKLGKHTLGKSCLYVKRLADLDLDILRELVRDSVAAMREKYPEGDAKAPAKQAGAKKSTAPAKQAGVKQASAKQASAKKSKAPAKQASAKKAAKKATAVAKKASAKTSRGG